MRKPNFLMYVGPQRRLPNGAVAAPLVLGPTPDLDELLDVIDHPEQTRRRGHTAVPRFSPREQTMLRVGLFTIASELPPGYFNRPGA